MDSAFVPWTLQSAQSLRQLRKLKPFQAFSQHTWFLYFYIEGGWALCWVLARPKCHHRWQVHSDLLRQWRKDSFPDIWAAPGISNSMWALEKRWLSSGPINFQHRLTSYIKIGPIHSWPQATGLGCQESQLIWQQNSPRQQPLSTRQAKGKKWVWYYMWEIARVALESIVISTRYR